MSPGMSEEKSDGLWIGKSRLNSAISYGLALPLADKSVPPRPACQVEEKMECVQSTVSQCSTETRIGSTGEEEQVEVSTFTFTFQQDSSLLLFFFCRFAGTFLLKTANL